MAVFDHTLKMISFLAIFVALFFISDLADADQGFGVYAPKTVKDTKQLVNHFSIFVIQVHGWDIDNATIKKIAFLSSKEKQIIVDFEFLRSSSERWRGGALPSEEEVVSDFSLFLSKLKPYKVYAFSLDEENKPSKQREEFLGRLYRALKSRYPGQKFFQWYGIGKGFGDRQLRAVLSTPSDGWIIDPYTVGEKEYDDILKHMSKTKKQIFSVVWLAPGWRLGEKNEEANGIGWNKSRWRDFYDRMSGNNKYNVSTIFFMYTKYKGHLTPIWNASQCDRAFYEEFYQHSLPYLRGHALLKDNPVVKPNWMPGYCR